MRVVSLSFDDGFLDSCLRIAAIYEEYGLSACINVIATGHLDSFVSPDSGHDGIPKGDFDTWNHLLARGHEVMPHGYKHANKSTVSFEEGKKLILDCLAIFEKELNGFESKDSIFNFPYNRSTPELEEWLPQHVRAYRTEGDCVNSLPSKETCKLTTLGYGPGNCEKHLVDIVDSFLERDEGWLIYNVHGLDNEGWGPIGTDFLRKLLDRLSKEKDLEILPVGVALKRLGG